MGTLSAYPRRAFAAIGMATLVATFAPSALAQGDDDKEKTKETIIEITDAKLGGNGCRPGKSKIYSYQSGGPKSPIDSFLVEHTSFAVGTLADKKSQNRAFCNAGLKIELPVHPDKTKGYQFGIQAMRQSGFMDLKEGVTANIKTTIGMRIVGALKLTSAKITNGPFKGQFNDVVDTFYDENGKELPYWSVCGREPTFNVATQVKITGGGAARKESGVILEKVTNDETDTRQNFAQDFRIHWRECTLPTDPDQDDS